MPVHKLNVTLPSNPRTAENSAGKENTEHGHVDDAMSRARPSLNLKAVLASDMLVHHLIDTNASKYNDDPAVLKLAAPSVLDKVVSSTALCAVAGVAKAMPEAIGHGVINKYTLSREKIAIAKIYPEVRYLQKALLLSDDNENKAQEILFNKLTQILVDACERGNVGAVSSIIAVNMTMNCVLNNARSPLKAALEYRQHDIVRMLIANGAQPTVADMILAARTGNPASFLELLQTATLKNTTSTSQGKRAFIAQLPDDILVDFAAVPAIKAPGLAGVLNALGGQTARFVHHCDEQGRTPLHFAEAWGNEEQSTALRAAGADENIADIYKKTPNGIRSHLKKEKNTEKTISILLNKIKMPYGRLLYSSKETHQVGSASKNFLDTNILCGEQNDSIRKSLLNGTQSHQQSDHYFGNNPDGNQTYAAATHVTNFSHLEFLEEGISPRHFWAMLIKEAITEKDKYKEHTRAACALFPDWDEKMYKAFFSDLNNEAWTLLPRARIIYENIFAPSNMPVTLLPLEYQFPELNTPGQYAVRVSSDREKFIEKIEQNYKSDLVFHGSPIHNWHQIVHQDLESNNDAGLQIHGSADGSGIYAAERSYLADIYAGATNAFGSRILGLVQIPRAPFGITTIRHKNKKDGDIFVVPFKSLVQLRFIIVYPPDQTAPDISGKILNKNFAKWRQYQKSQQTLGAKST